MVKYFVEKGANIEAKNNDGDTPLHYACLNQKTEIVKYFIEKGANIEAKNKNGNTPLHYACMGCIETDIV